MGKKTNTFDSHTQAETNEPALGPETGLILVTGLVLALSGLALCAGPSTTPKLADVTKQLGEAGLQGGTLIVGGLILVALGLLRRGQQVLELEIWRAENDPVQRQIAEDVLDTRDSLASVDQATTTLAREVKEVQAALHAMLQKNGTEQALEEVSAQVGHTLKAHSASLQHQMTTLEANVQACIAAQFTACLETLTEPATPATPPEQAAEVTLKGLPQECAAGFSPLDETLADPTPVAEYDPEALETVVDQTPVADPFSEPPSPTTLGFDPSVELDLPGLVDTTQQPPTDRAAHPPTEEAQPSSAPATSPPTPATPAPTTSHDEVVAEAGGDDEPLMIDLDDDLPSVLPSAADEAQDALAGLGNDDELNISDDSLRQALKRLSQDAG